MQADERNHSKIVGLFPQAGVIRFEGLRALLLDAVAMGPLRKYFSESFDPIAARTLLTQFGFAHGWRMAEAKQVGYKLNSINALRLEGRGIYITVSHFWDESGNGDSLTPHGEMLGASYKAEQHVLDFGFADAPMCWTICGLISGYLSRTAREEVYVLEDHSWGEGDTGCHLFGRTREEWGDERAEELSFYDPTCLRNCLESSHICSDKALNVDDDKLDNHRQAAVKVGHEIEVPCGVVAKSLKMRQLVDLARRAAKVDSTALITGESGSGKEHLARLMHEESTRSHGPFVTVNCNAIAETLLESELFGHTRGAFTGATQDRAGLMEAANGGTMLLSEIGEVSLGMQLKLLRAIQAQVIRRIGESKSRKVDVRIVAATTCNLALRVANGTFREDLYYRLKVIELQVPPLRERSDDILPLARVLLAKSALRMQRKNLIIPPSTAHQLLHYEWPGNVRELENAMECAVALVRGNRVELADLPKEIAAVKFTRLPEDLASLSAHDMQQTIHELRSLHIELQTQNEELRRTQAGLDAARARYFDLYDLAPVGYCIISLDGLILEANLTAVTLLGLTRAELVKQPITHFIHKDDQNIYYLNRKQHFDSRETSVCELRMIKKDRTAFLARLTTIASKEPSRISGQETDRAFVTRVVVSVVTQCGRVIRGRPHPKLSFSKSKRATSTQPLSGGESSMDQRSQEPMEVLDLD